MPASPMKAIEAMRVELNFERRGIKEKINEGNKEYFFFFFIGLKDNFQ